jgi:hypothetical protein
MPQPSSSTSKKAYRPGAGASPTRVSGEVGRARVHRARAQPDPAAPLGDGLGGVHEQVGDGVSELRAVGLHHADAARALDLEVDRARHRRAVEVGALAHERAEVRPLDDEAPAPGVREHLARQLRRSLRRGEGLGERVRLLGAGRGVGHRELEVAGDGEQQVVEVVRDAAREHAQALVLLRDEQPALELDAALVLVVERAVQGLALAQLGLRAQLREAEVGDERGELHQEAHHVVEPLALDARHLGERGEVVGAVEPVALGLRDERGLVEGLVREQELARVEVAAVHALDHERRDDVPELVLAAVGDELADAHVAREVEVALRAVAAGVGVEPVEVGADALPAGRLHDAARQVEDRRDDREDARELVEQGLDVRDRKEGREVDARRARQERQREAARRRRAEGLRARIVTLHEPKVGSRLPSLQPPSGRIPTSASAFPRGAAAPRAPSPAATERSLGLVGRRRGGGDRPSVPRLRRASRGAPPNVGRRPEEEPHARSRALARARRVVRRARRLRLRGRRRLRRRGRGRRRPRAR